MPPPQPEGSPVLAIISLVCGIVGIITSCCCGLLGLPIPLAALICGGIALAQPNSQGKGMAIGGVILGVLGFVVAIVMVVIALSNPQFMQDLQRMQNR
jgi:Na+/H+ antiporter NhaD/arsenite permease-like protein